MTNFVLIGGGALAIEVASYVADINKSTELNKNQTELLFVSDIVSTLPMRDKDLESVLGYKPNYNTNLHDVDNLREKSFVICIGDPKTRYKISKELEELNANLGKIIHPTAYIAATAKISAGAVICPHAFVGPFAQIDKNVLINVHATIGHDVFVGLAAVLSPGVHMNGHSRCGAASFVGSGATLNPKTELGDFSMLSAGSVLTKKVGDGFLMHGNPASGRQMTKIPNP